MSHKPPVITAFLSSTSRDLREHRSRIREHCERLGYVFRMMEEFGAQDDSALRVSLSEFDGCQVLIGVYARRYGFVPLGTEKSVTEAEYDEAKRASLPRLLFVVAPHYSSDPLIEANRDDTDAAQAARLRRFLDRVGTERVWDTFTTPEHLANRVAFALSKWEGWRPPRSTPPRYRFVGRDELLRRIGEGLTASRRLALVGLGGMGKTLTAAEVARREAAHFSGGVLWIVLGTEAKDPDGVLQATLKVWAACHHPGRLADPSNLTPEIGRHWLEDAPGPVLVVLDDVWHEPPAREILRMLPETASLLVTTRRADVARQLGLESVAVDRLSPEESIALLRDRIGDFPSLTALRRMAELLEGHPLALEIVSAQIANGPPDLAESLPDAIAARLSDSTRHGLGFLEADLEAAVEPAHEDRARYASVSAALGLTLNTFPEGLKRRFRATGVLAPDALLSHALLAAIWEDDLADESARQEFDSRLTALVSASVFRREADALSRHTLIRHYALAEVRRVNEARSIEDRYIAYVLGVILPRLQAISPDRWDLELGDDLPHVYFVGDLLVARVDAAYRWNDRAPKATPALRPSLLSRMLRMLLPGQGRAFAPPDESSVWMVQFAAGVERYLEHRREVAGARWLEAAAAVSQAAGERHWEVRFLNALARSHYNCRDSVRGMKAAFTARQIAFWSDPADQARAELLLGYHYTHMDPLESEKHFARAARAFQKLNDAPGQVEALIHLSGCRADSINSPHVRREGFDLLRKALNLARFSGDHLGEVRALTQLGNLHETCAEYTDARIVLEEAVSTAHKLRNQAEAASALLGLAGVLVELDELSDADEALDAALQLFDTVGDRVGKATALRNAAQVAELRGDLSRAAELYTSALPLIRQRTMLELDKFWDEDMRAARTLLVRLDDVLTNDTREQFRARAYEELRRRKDTAGSDPDKGGGLRTGHMPEDVSSFLIRKTIEAAGDVEMGRGWATVLDDFARRIDRLGASWAPEAECARALCSTVRNGAGELPESHPYNALLAGVGTRIERKKAGRPTYELNELRLMVGNVLAVKTSSKEKKADWEEQLRRMRQDAKLWGDDAAAEFLNALLWVMQDRLCSLSSGNPYCAAFRELENALAQNDGVPIDHIERMAIHAKRTGGSPLGQFRSIVEEALELSILRRMSREREFLSALLAVLEDQTVALSPDHAYGPSLAYIVATFSGSTRTPELPPGQIRMMYDVARDAGTHDEARLEEVQRMFTQLIATSDLAGDTDESEFFRALLAITNGAGINLPRTNCYRVYLESRMGILI